ncbi:MAG: helix-turn-helix domain-containing protein [Erysipelotrichaceae bacterium]
MEKEKYNYKLSLACKKLKREKKLTNVKLQEISGIPATSIQRMMSGGTVTVRTLLLFADALHLTDRQLIKLIRQNDD